MNANVLADAARVLLVRAARGRHLHVGGAAAVPGSGRGEAAAADGGAKKVRFWIFLFRNSTNEKIIS